MKEGLDEMQGQKQIPVGEIADVLSGTIAMIFYFQDYKYTEEQTSWYYYFQLECKSLERKEH